MSTPTPRFRAAASPLFAQRLRPSGWWRARWHLHVRRAHRRSTSRAARCGRHGADVQRVPAALPAALLVFLHPDDGPQDREYGEHPDGWLRAPLRGWHLEACRDDLHEKDREADRRQLLLPADDNYFCRLAPS